MICMGVDPSSSITGVCVLDGDAIVFHKAFKTVQQQPVEINMHIFHNWLTRVCKEHHVDPYSIDFVIVEKVSVSWNVNTIRKIAYFEAVAMLWATRTAGAVVYQPQATKARRIVFGKGNMSKEACYDRVKKDYPDEEWKTMDEADAFVLAKAGEGLVNGE